MTDPVILSEPEWVWGQFEQAGRRIRGDQTPVDGGGVFPVAFEKGGELYVVKA